MANADIVLSVSQEELTSLSQNIYAAVSPQVFVGNFPFQGEGTNFTVNWNVETAPIINLEPSAAAALAAIDFLSKQVPATHAQNLDPRHVTASIKATADAANCSARLSRVVLTISTPGMRDVTITLDITVYCFAQIISNQVTLVPTQLIAAPQNDPLYDLLVQKFLLPELLPLLNNHLASLSIPSINIEGIALSPLSLVIENGHIVAATNLATKGPPPPPNGPLWTEAGLSVLFSQDALQAGAAYGITQANASSPLHNSGSSGGVLGYYWGYSCSLGTPVVALNGTNLDLTLPVNASASGGGILFGAHIGVDYKAIVQPTPQPIFSLAVSGNHLLITLNSINTVAILLEPAGNVGEQILSWMLAGIVNAISTSFSTILTTFIKNINFPLITVPSYSPTIGGITFTITPANLALSNMGGMLALGGGLTLTRK